MSKREPSRVELYTKMTIALGAFGALVVFVYIHVMLPPDVPPWVFGLMLSILSAMLGVDIFREWQNQKDNDGP